MRGGEKPHYDGKNQCLSVKSHGIMWNLQMYKRMLVIAPIQSGAMWQQAMARIHRSGFEGDRMDVYTFTHTTSFMRGMLTARATAAFLQNAGGEPQRLLYSNRVIV